MPRFTDLSLPGLALLLAAPAAAYEDGAPPAHTGGFGEPDCHACHADNDPEDSRGRLQVSGLPEYYVAGERYELTVMLQHPALESGGLQLSLRLADGRQAGQFDIAADTLQVVSTDDVAYVVHTDEGRNGDTREDTADGVLLTWAVSWTAPDEGDAWLHVAANAANDDYSALGDFIYTLAAQLTASPR